MFVVDVLVVLFSLPVKTLTSVWLHTNCFGESTIHNKKINLFVSITYQAKTKSKPKQTNKQNTTNNETTWHEWEIYLCLQWSQDLSYFPYLHIKNDVLLLEIAEKKPDIQIDLNSESTLMEILYIMHFSILLRSLNCSSRNYVVVGIIWEKNVMLSNEKILTNTSLHWQWSLQNSQCCKNVPHGVEWWRWVLG